ncbi:alpha/beta fold hydrolase [Rhodococcus zopfii]|uniref:alpha/beta fold hydrolase n=1 Tax=Rhodococcus zopfii TaxID=43772 RepID=UPI001F0ED725|nr:alpha/beta fold hydrolase [Rhodococcus zopfii]
MRALAAAGYRAIGPDMPGYGGEYTDTAVADRLVRLLDAFGIDRAVLVGHDSGAPTTWTVARRHRRRVAGLVLLAVPYAPRPAARATHRAVRGDGPPALPAHALLGAAGHFAQMERAREVDELLVNFVSEVATAHP